MLVPRLSDVIIRILEYSNIHAHSMYNDGETNLMTRGNARAFN
jgi:hypothetical protein